MNARPTANSVDILLVEDNPGDVRLIFEAFKEGKVRSTLHVASDGVEALAFLHRMEPYTGAPRPHLILLDLNLPRRGGWEVLAKLKGDPDLQRIPVIVFTSSTAEKDILQAYALHANCYIPKPMDLDQFLSVMKLIENFWLTLVILPPW